MFTSIRIKGFRSCQDVTLDGLDDVQAFIGRNGAGKSTVLKAIYALSRLARATGAGDEVWDIVHFAPESISDGEDLGVSFTADISLGESSYHYYAYALRKLVEADQDGGDPDVDFVFREHLDRVTQDGSSVRIFVRDNNTLNHTQTGASLSIGSGVAAMHAIAGLLPENDYTRIETEPLRLFFAGVRYLPLDEPADTAGTHYVTARDYSRWVAEYKSTGNLGKSVPTQILHLHESRRDRFKGLKTLLGPMRLLLIEDIKVSPAMLGQTPAGGRQQKPQFFLVAFQPTNEVGPGGVWMAYGELSQGTRRLVRLVTALSYDDYSVALIEHPEDGVHKGLVRKVAGLFTTSATEGQVFLSTHSDTLMNALDPTSVRFVSLENGNSAVRGLSGDELRAATEYIAGDHDGTLAEFLHSVEG